MKDQSSSHKLQQRRRFLATAIAGGAGTLMASGVIAHATESNVAGACEELSAADPLYIYTSLVQKLQPEAIEEGRKLELIVQKSQADKLRELWVLSEKLKQKLPGKSTVKSAVERVNSLAYIGQTNAEAVRSGLTSRSRATLRAHAKSQNLILSEIVNASASLAGHDVRISAEAWALLQEMLSKIDEIRKYEPEVERARETFNQTITGVNDKIAAIQSALMDASSNIVKGEKQAAKDQVTTAIGLIKTLPGYDQNAVVNPDKKVTAREAEKLTPNKFVAMLDPGVLSLIDGTQPTPAISTKRSKNGATGLRFTPAVYVSGSENEPTNAYVGPETVKAIVKECLVSGSWWQVVAVAAVCLPLWSYPRSEQRKSLIYSALTAIPRGPKSRLWDAAYFLNELRS